MASGYLDPVIYCSSLVYKAIKTINRKTDNEAVCRGAGNECRFDVAEVKRHVGDVFFIVIRVIIKIGIERVNLFVSRTERGGRGKRRSRRDWGGGGRCGHRNAMV